jgi:hypothetical protein
MKNLLPLKTPIHGLSYSQLLRNALLWGGLIRYHKGLWVLEEEFYLMDDAELNELLNNYLTHRDD